jgi:hypothetical protein
MKSLSDAISYMHETRSALQEAENGVLASLLTEFPQVHELLNELSLPESKASTWLCAKHFDHGTKSAADLCVEGRGEEVIARVKQIAHGIYP